MTSRSGATAWKDGFIADPAEPSGLVGTGDHTDVVPHKSLGLTLSFLTGLQILVSFGMQGYIVTFFGAGSQADAFYAGSTLSQLVAYLMIDTLPMVLVPLLSASTEEELRAQGWVMCLMAVLWFTAITVVLSVTAGVFMPLLVAGFSTSGKDLTVSLTRIHLVGLAGSGCAAVLTSIHQVRNRFIWPALAMLLSGLLAWAFLGWTLREWGITAAAWSQVLAVTAPAVLLLPVLGIPRQFRWRPLLISELWRRLRPLVLARIYYLTSTPVDRLLASFLAPGSLVMFELVSRLYASIQRVLNQGVVIPMLPQLSRLAQRRQWRQFRSLYAHQVGLIVALSLASMGMVEACALGAIHMLSGPSGLIAGRLSADDLRQIALLVAYMSGLLPCMTLVNALSNAFYARGNTVAPAQIGAVVYTIGVVLRVAGFSLGGIKGMALAATVSAIIACIWFYLALKNETIRLIRKENLALVAVRANAD